MMDASERFLLLAYFLDERDEDGEEVRFAVSAGPAVERWTPIAGGQPILRSTVGERGVRDPFLVRLPNREIVVLATDLRIWPDSPHGWERAIRHGSRSIVTWRTADLVQWSAPHLIEVSPVQAGNTWAPKAFWSPERQAFLMFWASALFEGTDRSERQYQRILVAETRDFVTFAPPEIYLDRGHDVIDVTFAQEGDAWYRFSVDGDPPIDGPRGYITVEVGTSLEDPSFEPVGTGLGSPEMVRAEGPAIAARLDARGWTLLLDEFGLRGYQVFQTDQLHEAAWTHLVDVGLPAGARHGSLLPITSEERQRLLDLS